MLFAWNKIMETLIESVLHASSGKSTNLFSLLLKKAKK